GHRVLQPEPHLLPLQQVGPDARLQRLEIDEIVVGECDPLGPERHRPVEHPLELLHVGGDPRCAEVLELRVVLVEAVDRADGGLEGEPFVEVVGLQRREAILGLLAGEPRSVGAGKQAQDGERKRGPWHEPPAYYGSLPAMCPPSMGRATPVTKDDSSEARYTAAQATSSGWPSRRSGMSRVSTFSPCSRVSPRPCTKASTIGDRVHTGQSALARIPLGAPSSARVWTSCSTAALLGP